MNLTHDSPHVVSNPTVTAVDTTGNNNYQTVYTWYVQFLNTKIFRFLATGNSLHVKVLGSYDKTNFDQTAIAEFTVTTSTTATIKKISTYYPYLQIQVQPAVASAHGVLATELFGTSEPDMSNITVQADIDTQGMEVKQDAANVLLTQIAAQTPSNAIPYGATLVRIAADGAAGAAVSAIMPAVVGKKNYVLGYHVTVDTAATTGAMTAVLTDDTTGKGTEVMAGLSPVGTTRTQSASLPIMVNDVVNKTASIVCSAPGGATVIHATIWGYNL